MAKEKGSVFFCRNCGYESVKWMGQCPGCREWNSMVEAPARARTCGEKKRSIAGCGRAEPLTLSEIDMRNNEHITSGMRELDRVLGGGIVPGSLVLVGGDPGIGKSTLLLQLCRDLAGRGILTLYISGEESPRQIKLRAERIGSFTNDMRLLCETEISAIEEVVRTQKPAVVIIDSIQTMQSDDTDSAPGSVSQVREATGALLRIAKSEGITVFIVGHVTKEGVVAGPRMLEHMVDTVLYFEGDRHASYRILRSVKNRFGSTNEIGVFQMRPEGLQEVQNPSEYMLSGKPEGASGSIVTCSIEGTRPILLEVQALVTKSAFGIPRRTAAGADLNRVNLLMAVLEKRAGITLSDCDAYVNIAGGMKIREPAVDLGIVLALMSSCKEKPVCAETVCFGEVGLSGEVRAVSMAGRRIAEAEKLGFSRCIVPSACVPENAERAGIDIIGVSTAREAVGELIDK